MEEACLLVARILDELEDFIKPNITTEDIDSFCEKKMRENGAIPACKGYKGYPKSTCTSVNSQVCHTIPTKNCVLKDGDIISVDITAILDGWFGDSCRTYHVGTKKYERLVNTAYDSMWNAIGIIKAGVRTGDLGYEMEKTAQLMGYSTVLDFAGHGIGRVFHDDPMIPFSGKKGKGKALKAGECITIEPMVNEGSPHIKILDDGWTAITLDGKMSAQFEHTVRVLQDGYEVLTYSKFDKNRNKKERSSP